MKKPMLVLTLSVLLVFSVQSAQAGISLGKGGITLQAGQSEEMCDIWIYATQGGGTYNVETTGDLKPLTVSVTPNDFTLDPIDCPEESGARRACISELCMSNDQSSCRIVCVRFTAPMLIEWSPQKVIYDGAILNTMKIGAATIKEPYTFSVHVNPMDMKPIVTLIVVIIIILVIAVLFMKKLRKKR